MTELITAIATTATAIATGAYAWENGIRGIIERASRLSTNERRILLAAAENIPDDKRTIDTMKEVYSRHVDNKRIRFPVIWRKTVKGGESAIGVGFETIPETDTPAAHDAIDRLEARDYIRSQYKVNEGNVEHNQVSEVNEKHIERYRLTEKGAKRAVREHERYRKGKRA